MNALVRTQFGAVSTKFANRPVENDLSANIQGGFGLIGYRGKVWSTRFRGEEIQLMRADGDGPRSSIEVVVVKASPSIAKIFYEGGWVEGSNAPPDCFSTNGVTPDAGVQKKFSATCAACPKNAWGSRITPAGKQGKACSDSRRLAVVPLQDLRNELLGGPMLLRVPAASLQEFAAYGDRMGKLGYPYYSIGTRIGFDPQESYPKFLVSEIRPLSDEEADIVLALQGDPLIARILAEGSEHQDVEVAPAAKANFEQPKPEAAPPATPTITAQALAARDAAVAAAKIQAEKAAAVTAAQAKEAADAAKAKAKSEAKAAAKPTGGFGAAPAKAAEATPAPEQASPDEPAPAGTSFEDDIDAKMAALMGDKAA